MATKTPEMVKAGMRFCASHEFCEGCPLEKDCYDILADGLAVIEQLEEQIMCMQIQMHGDCGVCAHRDNAQITKHGPDFSGPCAECITKETRPNWKYEGLPEVKSR